MLFDIERLASKDLLLFEPGGLRDALLNLPIVDVEGWWESNRDRLGPLNQTSRPETSCLMPSAEACIAELDEELKAVGPDGRGYRQVLWAPALGAVVVEVHLKEGPRLYGGYTRASLFDRRVYLKKGEGEFYRAFTWVE